MKGLDVDNSYETIWGELQGQRVQIHRDGTVIRSGYVEAVTHTGDGLWLQSHGIEARALYTKEDGYFVRVMRPQAQDNK